MKNTRLLYTDEAHIKMYEAMPCEQFKEFMLTVLKYKYGDDSILDTIQDPMVRALFMAEKQHIDYNEKKWADKAKIARENGSKSKGRPKKTEEPQVSASNGTPLPPPPSRPKPPTSIEGPDYENRNMEEIAEYLYGIYLTKTDDAVYREMNGNPYLKQHYDEVNAAYIEIKNKHREAYV